MLHGWPQSRALYANVVDLLAVEFFVLALDLPNIGDSRGAPSSSEKSVLADVLITAAESVGARSITIAGVDVGGMIAFAAARDHGARIQSAIVMNTAIPGVAPWDEVVADPRIWQFGFHALQGLPQVLVHGHERAYFDFFTDALAAEPRRISPGLRNQFAHAYARRESLTAGFDWYRAMPADGKHNAKVAHITTPLLYLRGDADRRRIEDYAIGLRDAGVLTLETKIVRNSGELIPVEASEQFVHVASEFARRSCSDERT